LLRKTFRAEFMLFWKNFGAVYTDGENFGAVYTDGENFGAVYNDGEYFGAVYTVGEKFWGRNFALSFPP
jgi:hypothetical protein